MTSKSETVILEASGISKSFPGVLALRSVRMDVRRGEVHALIGENGAGKSTLVNIFAGALQPDEGSLFFRGDLISHLDPHRARMMGIGLIRQEPTLVPHLSVYENITLGVEKQRFGFPRKKMLIQKVEDHLRNLRMQLNPLASVERLSSAQKQLVAIAKTMFHDPVLIIMDEPTATLTATEKELIFSLVRRELQRGKSFVYISHRLEEIFEIAQRVTVLRDGGLVATVEVGTAIATLDSLIAMMVGRELSEAFPERRRPRRDRAHRLIVRNVLNGICADGPDLTVEGGEILGIAGLVGSGRTELVRAIFGANGDFDLTDLTVELDGKAFAPKSPADSVARGLALVPEDRRGQGLVGVMSVRENISLSSPQAVSRWGWLDQRRDRKASRDLMQALSIRAYGPDQVVRNLSGGNQQKVVIAKWMLREAEVIIFDEPTKGVDVGAKVEIYRHIIELADRGKIVIMVSSELPEILGLSDKILVMHKGRVAAHYRRDEATPDRILSAALGVRGR